MNVLGSIVHFVHFPGAIMWTGPFLTYLTYLHCTVFFKTHTSVTACISSNPAGVCFSIQFEHQRGRAREERESNEPGLSIIQIQQGAQQGTLG